MNTSTGTTGYAEGSYTPEALRGWSDQCCDQVSRAVDQNPSGMLLTAFAAGLGIGIALTMSVAVPSRKAIPRSMPEELGSRVLAALQEMMPESIARRMG